MKHKHVICRASFKKNPKMYIFSKLKLYLKNYAGGHKISKLANLQKKTFFTV